MSAALYTAPSLNDDDLDKSDGSITMGSSTKNDAKSSKSRAWLDEGKQRMSMSVSDAGRSSRSGADKPTATGIQAQNVEQEPFWRILIRESAVAIWVVILLIVIIAVQFIIIGEVRKTSVAAQSDLISADIRRATLTFFQEKLAVLRNHKWLYGTGQILADNMVEHPRFSQVNPITKLPNPIELQKYEAVTSAFFAQDPDLVAMYMAMSNDMTWKVHRETPPFLATQLRWAGNVSGTPYFERYERRRLFNDSLNDFTLASHQVRRYSPREQGWYQDASAAPLGPDGQPQGVWSGPEFQGQGIGTAADSYGLDPVMVYSLKVNWRQPGLYSCYKLKMLTRRVNIMLRSLDVPRNGDVVVVNAQGLIAGIRTAADQVIPDPTDPTNAGLAQVRHISSLPKFSSVTAADIAQNVTSRNGAGISIYSLDEAIQGWRVVVYLDGKVLVEPFKPFLDTLLAVSILLIVLSLLSIAYSANNVRRQVKASSDKAFSQMLLDLMPSKIAYRCISRTEWPICDRYPDATVMFADMVSFTNRSAGMDPHELVLLLNTLVESFDAASVEYRVEKIKTIGDCYMAVSGVPVQSRTHAIDMVRFCWALQSIVRAYNDEHVEDPTPIFFRCGVHSGELIMGVIGSRRFAFDVFGDTVNVASRFESNSQPGRIRVSGNTFDRTKQYTSVTYSEPESIQLKGKDKPMMAYFVMNVDE